MKYLILFLFLLSITYSQIVLNIKKEESSDFYSNFLLELRTTFELGDPSQIIETEITFANNYFFIIGEGNKNSSYFDKDKSSSFTLGNKTDVINLPFKEGYLSTDLFNFEDVNGKKKKLNFNFLYALKPNKKENLLSQIGFSLFNSPHGTTYNLINQLNKQNIINSYVYYFDFNKDNSKIVIGEYAEKYQSKTRSKLVTTEIEFVIFPEYLKIEFENFIFGNATIDHKININFDFNIKGLIGNELFKKKINESFFHELIDKKICSQNNYRQYIFFECNSNLEINKFYMKISDKWTFGFLFLEKYKTVINFDRRMIGFYIPSLQEKSRFWISLLIIFILLFIAAGLTFYYYKLLKNKRKIRVNEIEENIDYTPIKT